MTKNLVSFVVLNWNGLEDTLVCLDSIRHQTGVNYEILVVDNGSNEHQKAALSKIKDITLVSLEQNMGFTGGQIAGLEFAKGEFIALVNNDAVISPNWAKQATTSLKANENAAAVGGKAFVWNDKNEKAFSETNAFYSYQVVNPVTGHTRTLMYGDNLSSVHSISGSGVMIKRTVIDEVGYFDNRFFAYYEETDLFARYKRAGYQIIYDPALHTWHKIAQSTKSMPGFYLYFMHRNRFIFAIKNYDRRFAFKFARYYLAEWLRACLHVLRRGKNANTESKKLAQAGFWNYAHIASTLSARRKVLRTGESYVDKLLNDSTERITVIITCYNYADYVSEAIESVLRQSVLPYEIIVINDGSTDKSPEVISKYKEHIIIINQTNSGVVKTKNRGMRQAKGDWVVFLDADDILEPDYLEQLLKAAHEQNADVSYSAMKFFGNENDDFTSRPYSEYSLLKGNYINNSALIRREKLLIIGGYKNDMSFGYEDWELYISLSSIGARFAYTRKPLLLYRRHVESSRDKQAKENLKHTKEIIAGLHPDLFSLKHRTLDILESLVSFHKRRTPLQIFKDLRYIFITRLDKKSESSILLTKLLGFARLILNGKFTVIVEKINLNAKRLKRKILGSK